MNPTGFCSNVWSAGERLGKMAAHHPQVNKFDQLRRAAERLLAQRPEAAPQNKTDILSLIQELRIYETELEIQNEELQRAQQELADLKQEFEALYELAPCGYITLNPKGIIERVNLTGVVLLGDKRTKVRGTSMAQYVDAAYHDAFYAARKASGATGEKQRLEMPLTSASGEPLWVRADIEAECEPTGRVLQWRIILTDISKRVLMDKQRVKLEDQLQQAKKMQALGTLAAGIAHEFNNMLAVIIGNVELAIEDLPKNHPTVEYMNETMTASRRAKEVVSQLLTFTRKNIHFQKPLQLEATLYEALHMIRSSTPANIEIVNDIQEHLYPIMADATQIHQVIINLCSNAVDAMSTDNGVLTIRLENVDLDDAAAQAHPPLTPGRYVRLTVSDTGQGMDETTQAQIFEPFYTTKAVGKGTGMGLSVVDGIVGNHGGAIFVKSQPGNGSTFRVFFPESRRKPPTKAPAGVGPYLNGNRERILFIDDEPALTKMGSRQLQRLGYTVEAFTQPTEALIRFEANPEAFDLIISDMAMPQITGKQLVGKIHRIRKDIPIIICTGYSERLDAIQAAELGVHSCLIKPYRLTMLSDAADSALSSTKAPT